MGEVQEQRYPCKVCRKTFVSGRSLGGHMRTHLAATGAASRTAAKADQGGAGDRLKESTGKDQSNSVFSDAPYSEYDDDDDDDDQTSSYGLRENPKKSWRISISGYPCEECGKEFPTSRALSGHMRTHSIKNNKGVHQCKKCGKGFDSIRAMFGHMKSHSKKRSVAPAGCVDDEDDDGFSGLENICPVRKKRSTIRYSIATPNPSSSYLNQHVECEAVFEVDEAEEVAEILIMLSKGVSIEPFVDKGKGVCGFDGVGSSFVAEDEVVKSGCAYELDEVFSVPDAANEEPAVSENGANLRIVKGFAKKRELIKCKIKEHECPLCFKVFPSGQALGGHKRAHYNSSDGFGVSAERRDQEVMTIVSGRAAVNQELGAEVDGEVVFDLNFSTGVDGGAKRDVGLSLWFGEMGREVLTI